MPCRAFRGRLGCEYPDFEAGGRRLMCPAGHLNQGWSLLVCRFFAGVQNDMGVAQNDRDVAQNDRGASENDSRFFQIVSS